MVDSREVGIEPRGESTPDPTERKPQGGDSPKSQGSPPAVVAKAQLMSVWSRSDKSWRNCVVTFIPPCLTIAECWKLDLKVLEKQLYHLKQRWYHGDIGRREARHILLDFKDTNNSFLVRGSQTCGGKFAISLRFHNRVIHVMIQSKPHPLTRVKYSISEHGPWFNSIYELVEECKKKSLILNTTFDIKLGRCVPKVDHSWLDRRLKTHLEAEKSFSDEQREGAFCVYQTDLDTDSYTITYRAEGMVNHAQILPTVRNRLAGYILNNIFSPVVYKIVHYYMENPIQADTVLRYPVGNLKLERFPLCGIALVPSLPPDLEFPTGAIIKNIHHDVQDPQVLNGDYGETVQKRFKAVCVRLLHEREELRYLESENLDKLPKLRPGQRMDNTQTDQSDDPSPGVGETEACELKTAQLDLSTEYRIKKDQTSANTIAITQTSKKGRTIYELHCSSRENFEDWSNLLDAQPRGVKKKGQCGIG